MSNSEVIRLLDKIGANDRHRNSVANSLSLVDPNTEKYGIVEKYLLDTHSPIHDQYSIRLVKLFEINAPYDRRFYDNNERNLFGQAIYFTNCSSKAANYTSTNQAKYDGAADGGKLWPDPRYCGFVFLSQVALCESTMHTKPPRTKNSTALLEGNDSIYRAGQYQPSSHHAWAIDEDYENIVDVPMGPLKRVYNSKRQCYLYRDEYAIYKSHQARHRFLLILKFPSKQ